VEDKKFEKWNMCEEYGPFDLLKLWYWIRQEEQDRIKRQVIG